jgi:hypothetical protein
MAVVITQREEGNPETVEVDNEATKELRRKIKLEQR